MNPDKGLNLDPEPIKQVVPGTLDRASISEQLAVLRNAAKVRAVLVDVRHAPSPSIRCSSHPYLLASSNRKRVSHREIYPNFLPCYFFTA